MSPQEVRSLIAELIILGEDIDEMEYYESIFADLEPESQQELYQSLLEETVELQKLALKP